MNRVGLAALPLSSCMDDAVGNIIVAIEQAANLGAEVVCLPEACLPGHRLQPDLVPFYPQEALDEGLAAVAEVVHRCRVAAIVGTERVTQAGVEIISTVINEAGNLLGHQAKTQLAPDEETCYVPGRGRSVFHAAGITFGIAICHEAFRYPETVRWASRAGAQVVFHPHFEGDNLKHHQPRQWCAPENTYGEKAILCRAVENTVYMASCNYALANQRTATCFVDPAGALVGRLNYGEPGVLVHDLDLNLATAEMALRYAPERFDRL